MAEFLLDDLQYVQLMVKEHHRRKRALEKLNKTKKHKFVKYAKYDEWHQKKYNKYYIEYEIKSIYNCNNDDIFFSIEDDYNNIYKDQNNDQNNEQNNEYEIKSNEYNNEYNLNLKQCFEFIEETMLYNKKKIINLKFPTQFVCHMTSLYETTIKKDISALFNSARYWNVNKNNIYKGVEGQAVVIGSYLNELINILSNIIIDCPIDIIYIISELVGNAIIWLRRPGLNIFKWSAKQHIFYNNYNNEFYFSGYIDIDIDCQWCNKLKELLNQNCTTQYLDLDWCFIVFLLLGLIPKHRNQYFRWYFNQKLLSALHGTSRLMFN